MRQLGRSRSLYLLRGMVLVGAVASGSKALITAPREAALSGDVVPAHDPVLIREGDRYYVYSTGQRDRRPLAARTSRDLRHWAPLPSPMSDLPDWARTAVPGAREMWAPDVARVGDR